MASFLNLDTVRSHNALARVLAADMASRERRVNMATVRMGTRREGRVCGISAIRATSLAGLSDPLPHQHTTITTITTITTTITITATGP